MGCLSDSTILNYLRTLFALRNSLPPNLNLAVQFSQKCGFVTPEGKFTESALGIQLNFRAAFSVLKKKWG